jgi:hypothetical protein
MPSITDQLTMLVGSALIVGILSFMATVYLLTPAG